MRLISRLWLGITFLALIYGLYQEFASVFPILPLAYLERGGGLLLAIVSGTMALTLQVLEEERNERLKDRQHAEDYRRVFTSISSAIAMHDRDFMALWPEQIARAKESVDVTNLMAVPPANLDERTPEAVFFKDLRRSYQDCGARIRRVERVTPAKHDWIRWLVAEMKGLPNVSLALYVDASDGPLPQTVSVCRVDGQYAWIIALAEHQATTKTRDILLMGSENVELVRRYFETRLWSQSTPVVTNGRVDEDALNGILV